MFKDRLRAMLGGGRFGSPSEAAPPVRKESFAKAPTVTRHSPSLEQFFSALRGREGLAILDLAGASQANVSILSSLGHRIYSDDFLQTLQETLARGETGPLSAERFLDQCLPLDTGGFHGALLWDRLQFLPPAFLPPAIDRLLAMLHRDAMLLAYFSADEKTATAPCCHYRIADERTLQLIPRGGRLPIQHFNNRALENLFQRFASTKFFLTRDHLREVLVKR
ncbi:MAG: hypothetical protein HY822_17290 [Acidobacteria bacterium]|nr:hypothetical protein [Acidobacteriota bacterium]